MHHRQEWAPPPFNSIPAALSYWAGRTPHALALTSGSDELTYGRLADEVAATASWLQSHGVKSGDRVMVVGHNTIAWVTHYLAALQMGAIIAPSNNRLNPSQFAQQADLLGARMVLVDAEHRGLASEVLPLAVHELIRRSDASAGLHAADVDPAREALVSFTSGTTGRPKGATLSHRALVAASWAFAQVLEPTSADSTLVMVPMFHNTGFVDQLGLMLLVGGRTDLLLRFRTDDAIRALEERPITYLAAVPSIVRLLMLADGADAALSSMRMILYGGSPMPSAWSGELLARWPAMRLFHGYGLTEYGSAVSFLPPEYAATRGDSVGFPVPGTRVRLVLEDGTEAPEGEVGELWVAGPTRMLRYWRQPELTAEKLHGEWLRTGDLARSDKEFLYIEGRIDDVINRGGEKVLPAHVEALLARVDAVAQSSVFGVPDDILQFRVWAAVEQRPGAPFDEGIARAQLSTDLPDYAVPERIVVVDHLPRTASGKVDRKAVAALVIEQKHLEKGQT